jgi:hypothetical protein
VDERQLGLALALKELGVDRNVSEFDGRLILQKSVYLLEEAGVRLGYAFNWYLRGPYSPALTRDLFNLSSSDDDIDGWVLDQRSRDIAERIRPLFEGVKKECAGDSARRLELFASLHYLARRGRLDIDDSSAATKQLEQNGKVFSTAEVASAIDQLKQVQLL